MINRWTLFRDVYQKLKTVAKCVCDKKIKRFEDYKEVKHRMDQGVCMITTLNTSCVASILCIIQDMLLSKRYLDYCERKRPSHVDKNLTYTK